MRWSLDIRKRVISFVEGGGSKTEAARIFKVGVASVHRWMKPGGLKHKRPGPKGPHKLDRAALRRHVDKHPDLTQAERARHFGVSRHCIWNGLRKAGLSRKENDGSQRAQPYEEKSISASS